jgi:hypothetical protein
MTAQYAYPNLTGEDIYIFPSKKLMEVRDNINNVERLVTFRLDRLVGFFVDWVEAELTLVVDGLHILTLRFDMEDSDWGHGQALFDLMEQLHEVMQDTTPKEAP